MTGYSTPPGGTPPSEDRVAAAEPHRFPQQGLRGAALTATTYSRRLAGETGADAPALRANGTRLHLTGRNGDHHARRHRPVQSRDRRTPDHVGPHRRRPPVPPPTTGAQQPSRLDPTNRLARGGIRLTKRCQFDSVLPRIPERWNLSRFDPEGIENQSNGRWTTSSPTKRRSAQRGRDRGNPTAVAALSSRENSSLPDRPAKGHLKPPRSVERTLSISF